MGIYQRLRRSDERIMESRIGWLLPGGAAYKLGQRDTRGDGRARLWPYLGGWLNGWNYNVGRERARRRQNIDE